MTTNYLQGYLQSGNTQFEKCNNITYLSNYKVSLFESKLNGVNLIAETTSNINGQFIFTLTDELVKPINSIYYLTAELNNIKLLAIIGNRIHKLNNIIINELTTIASLYCFTPFEI